MTIPSLPGAHPSVTWTERLGTAPSEPEVVAIVREYLARFTPEEVAELPEPCRPAKIVDAGDVAAYAFELVRHRDEDAGMGDKVHRIASVMSFAATRLSALAAQERPATQRSRQSA